MNKVSLGFGVDCWNMGCIEIRTASKTVVVDCSSDGVLPGDLADDIFVFVVFFFLVFDFLSRF